MVDKLRVKRVPVWGVYDGETQISYDCGRQEEAYEWMREEREVRRTGKSDLEHPQKQGQP